MRRATRRGRGLIAAVNAANTAGGGTINLAFGCTYTLTTADNPTDGGNGLPVVNTAITINGRGSTIARVAPSASLFRIMEVSTTGALTLNLVTITGGDTPNAAYPDPNGGGVLDEGSSPSTSAR